jgi:16S rRNA (guanine966-N2)-methyltransferase
VRIVQAASARFLQGPAEPFDIVFLDPPYHQGLLPECVRRLEAQGWLAPAAWIYLEAERGLHPALPDCWELYRRRETGQVGYHLARRLA